MLDRPQFKRQFHVEPVESVGVFLLDEQNYFVLTGEIYEALAPLIDGQRTTDELVELLEDKVSPAEVYYALMLMERKGYIADNAANLPAAVAAIADSANVERTEAENRWKTARITVTTFGNVSAGSLVAKLRELNLNVSESQPSAA